MAIINHGREINKSLYVQFVAAVRAGSGWKERDDTMASELQAAVAQLAIVDDLDLLFTVIFTYTHLHLSPITHL